MSPRPPLDAEPVEDLEEDPTDVSVAPGLHEGALVDGRYRVRRELGRGGMSVVYLAEHVELGRSVALKILRPPRSGRGLVDFGNWFKREARTLAGIQHPNVVTLHDFGRLDDGDFYLVMEYVDGPSLSRILRQHGPLEPREALQLFVQVCRALRHTHKRGIVHLDVKPSNLLVTADLDGTPLVKVIDFGLAEGGAVVEADDDVLAGSPHCMAPEQIEGRLTGPATDIYALGVVMYRTITGRWPFHGPTPRETLLAHLVNEPPPLAESAPELVLPDGLEAVVRRCLARDPAERYADAASLLAELARVLDVDGSDVDSQSLSTPAVSSSGVHAPPRPAPAPAPAPEVGPAPRASSAKVLVGGLVALGLIAAGAFWLLSDGPPAVAAAPPAAPPALEAPAVAPSGPGAPAGGSAEVEDPSPPAPNGSARPAARPKPEERPSGRADATPEEPAEPARPRRPARTVQRAPVEKPPAPPEPADEPSPTPPKGYKAMPDF